METVGGALHHPAPPLRKEALRGAIVFPGSERSAKPERAIVKFVQGDSGLVGAKVRTIGGSVFQESDPATGSPVSAFVTSNWPRTTSGAPAIASLNAATTEEPRGTYTAPFAGDSAAVGATQSTVKGALVSEAVVFGSVAVARRRAAVVPGQGGVQP